MIRGPWIARSYYKMPKTRTAGRLVLHRRRRDHRREGFMQITDRSKDVIKSGGEWISSIELENLAMAHPEIARSRRDRRRASEMGRAAAGHRGAQARLDS